MSPQEVAEVIGRHQYMYPHRGDVITCSCGWSTPRDFLVHTRPTHSAHVASVLQDEGMLDGPVVARQPTASGPWGALLTTAGEHPWIPGGVFLSDPTFQSRMRAALQVMVEEDQH
jgi:hypothetical protein